MSKLPLPMGGEAFTGGLVRLFGRTSTSVFRKLQLGGRLDDTLLRPIGVLCATQGRIAHVP
ncbi:MAG: hypothetical protein ACO3JL_06285 [Myxococcota bacterium]